MWFMRLIKQFSLFIPAISFLIILFLWTSCQDKPKIQETAKLDGPFNNTFFVLDLEKEAMTMDSFRQLFFTNFPHEDPTRGDVVYDRSKWLHDDLFDFEEKEGLYAYL